MPKLEKNKINKSPTPLIFKKKIQCLTRTDPQALHQYSAKLHDWVKPFRVQGHWWHRGILFQWEPAAPSANGASLLYLYLWKSAHDLIQYPAFTGVDYISHRSLWYLN